MEKEIIYRKVFIKSQDDLPKDDEYYFVGTYKNGKNIASWNHHNKWWDSLFNDNVIKFIDVDWYLQPIELPTEEEIKQACPQELIPRISCWIQGAKWLLNKIIGK